VFYLPRASLLFCIVFTSAGLQVIVCKDLSLKWPIMCQAGLRTLLSHSLTGHCVYHVRCESVGCELVVIISRCVHSVTAYSVSAHYGTCWASYCHWVEPEIITGHTSDDFPIVLVTSS